MIPIYIWLPLRLHNPKPRRGPSPARQATDDDHRRNSHDSLAQFRALVMDTIRTNSDLTRKNGGSRGSD
ncbi:MAG: hypothetical protein WKG07_29215 [Hymenobacter sp.]